MYEFVSIIIIIFGVLQIILFFKVWAMTNNVKNILNVLNSKDIREFKLPQKAKIKGKDKEVDVLGINNGKILCRIYYSNSWSDEYFNYDQLVFEE